MSLSEPYFSMNIITDGIVEWHKYTGEERVCSRFTLEEWHLAVSDVDTDKEWEDILQNSSYVNCYILKLRKNDEAIGFAYTKQEDNKGRILSIHGGGWEKSMRSSFLYYRGLIVLVSTLQRKGIKVQTSCLNENGRALRFLRSIGFVPYIHTNQYVYLWINEQRLKSSKIYKYIYATVSCTSIKFRKDII